MWKSYFLTAWRCLAKHKTYTAINVLGMSSGLACCIILLSFVDYRMSYDSQYPGSELVYSPQVNWVGDNGVGTSPYLHFSPQFKIQLQQQLPGIEKAAIRTETRVTLTVGDIHYVEWPYVTDQSFLEIFPLPYLEQSSSAPLALPGSVILTEKLAGKYFPDKPAIGQVLDSSVGLLTVTAVVTDIPENSHLKTFARQMFIASSTPALKEELFGRIYLLFANSAQADSARELFPQVAGPLPSPTSWFAKNNYRAANKKLIPLVGSLDEGSKTGVWMMSALAGLVLLLSCFNFVNLSTAGFSKRHREIGLRKALGANRANIAFQFLCETLLTMLLATTLAICLAELLMPWFKQGIGLHGISVRYSSWEFWRNLSGLALLTTILAGFYPAVLLSRSTPINALHGNNQRKGSEKLRFTLISLQFLITTVLITCSSLIFIHSQKTAEFDFGFNVERTLDANLTSINNNSVTAAQLKSAMLQHPDIESVSTNSYIHRIADPENFQLNGRAAFISPVLVDEDFDSHFQMSLVAGTSLSKRSLSAHSSIKPALVMLNDLPKLGIHTPESAIGQQLVSESGNVIELVGVVDAKCRLGISSPAGTQADLFVYAGTDAPLNFNVRYRPGTSASVRSHILQLALQMSPDALPEIGYPLALLEHQHAQHQSQAYAVGLVALLMILIAIAGLYASALFYSQRRTREIAVRKVHGASNGTLVKLLLTNFSKPVLIALLAGCPLSFLLANQIAQNFLNPPPVGLIAFVLVPAATLITAWAITVKTALQSVKAKPVDALGTE